MIIEYPTDIEIQQALENICDRAIKKPKNILAFIHDMAHNPGIRYIFYGTYDAVLISLCVFLIAGVFLGNSVINNPSGEVQIYAAVFSFSPLLFMLLCTLSFWKEKETDLYPLKMTCRYTIHHLLAFRMLTASVLGFVCTTGYVVILCRLIDMEFIHVLAVACASLLLFSIFMVQIILSKESFLSIVILCFAWLLFNGICFAASISIYSFLLRAVPTVIWIAVDILLGVALIRKYRLYVRRVYIAYD